MNIEIFTMDETNPQNKSEDQADDQALATDDQTLASDGEDGTNDSSHGAFDEDVCIQELDESRIGVVDQKKVQLYQKWVPFFINDGIALQDGNLICTVCRKQVSADKKSRLSEHINSKKHKKMAEIDPDERPINYEPYTPNAKRLKLSNGIASSTKTYSKTQDPNRLNRDKSHEILLADTLNLFVQLDVPFEKLNSDVWQQFVKKHVKNGDLILKNFSFYKTNG